MVNGRVLGTAALMASLVTGAESALAVTIGGFTFAQGESAFADDALLVSGAITCCNEAEIKSRLIGSTIDDPVNTGNSEGGIVEVQFLDNAILNEPGVDLIIFETSGPQGAGNPDPDEIFGLSVYRSSEFSPFSTVTPIDTGFPHPDPNKTTNIFAVEVDLLDFGIAEGETSARLRLHIFNTGVAKSADIQALGAKHSSPIPEPSTALLLGIGCVLLSLIKKSGGRWCAAARLQPKTRLAAVEGRHEWNA